MRRSLRLVWVRLRARKSARLQEAAPEVHAAAVEAAGEAGAVADEVTAEGEPEAEPEETVAEAGEADESEAGRGGGHRR